MPSRRERHKATSDTTPRRGGAAPAVTSFAPRARAIVAVACAVATVAVYAPALRAPFEFDDVPAIVTNASIHRLWPPSVPLNPPANTSVAGRPVVNYTLALNYAANELLGVDQRPDPDGPYKTVGFHLVNIALHFICAVLLFGIILRTVAAYRQLGGADAGAEGRMNSAVPAASPVTIAAAVTVLWMLHPLQSEAVDYIVQRTELLVSACYLATLYASIRAWDAPNASAARRWCVASVTVCLAGMGSKEVMIFAPLMVLLYDRVFRCVSWKDQFRRRGWFYASLFATCALSLMLISAGTRSSVGFGLGITWYEYLYSQAWAIAHYLRLAFWPSGLTIDYGERAVMGMRSVPGLLVLIPLAVATVVAWTKPNRWGWLGFIGAWFFLILAPSSSFVPIRTEIAAERRFYLPLAAVLVLVVIGFDAIRRRAAARPSAPSELRASALTDRAWWPVAGVALAFAVVTFHRSEQYNDLEALWRGAVTAVPGNPRAYDHLGAALVEQRPPRYAEAGFAFSARDRDRLDVPAGVDRSRRHRYRAGSARGCEGSTHPRAGDRPDLRARH